MNYKKGMILKKVKAGNDRTNIGMEITLVKKLTNGAWSTSEIGTYTENYLNENFELLTNRMAKGGKMREFKVGDIVVSDEFGEGKVFEMYWSNLENMFYANVKFNGNEKNKLYFPKTGKRYTDFGTDTITLKEEEKVSKYKVGDTVTIKKDLKEAKYYNEGTTYSYYAISDMVKLAGKTTKIKKVFSDVYKLEIDNSIYCWTDGMFEDVEIDKKKFEVGDIVCGNSLNCYGITNTNMTKGEVVQVFDDGMFEVKIIEHKRKSEIGEKFSFLDPKYFDLVSRVKDTKLPNEKFGFKIGETVLYNGEERKILAFDISGCKYFYISGTYDYNPSYNDRPISETFEFVLVGEVKHLPVKEPVKTTKYKVGDNVKIRSNLCNKSYCMEDGSNSAWSNESMIKFRGKSAIITKITLEGRYRIDLDKGSWYWVDDMFEGLVPTLDTERHGFKIGEKVMCKNIVETVLAFAENKESNCVYITGPCTCPPSGADRPINNWAIVNKDRLQHIPETPVAKVGMYVKVTLDVDGAPVGSICKIISVSDSVFICYYYKKPDTERTNWYGTIDLGLELMPEDYRPMRVFTGDQIAEAEQIIGRLSVALGNSGASYKLIRDGAKTKINIYSEYSSGVLASGSTKRSPYDTDNSTIGLMIALCRAIGKRYMIPKWVFNG